MLVGIAKECGFLPRLMSEETGANYTKPPIKGELMNRAREILDVIPTKEAIPGDLMLFRVGGEPQLITILTD